MDKEFAKEMNPSISVLMPIYNTAPYLREAIDSVLNQTFDDFELILLNDCSTDESLYIINSYSDSRIVVYNGMVNVGVANILNIGIKMARGIYIARMDSDDISLHNRFQIQYDFLQSHPDVDLCSCAMQQFGASDKLMQYNNDTEEVKFNAVFFSPILHASSMWKKDSFKKLFYEQDFVPAEDYRLWTKALVMGVNIVNIPDVLYRYRIHSEQTSAQKDVVDKATEKVRNEYVKMIYPGASEKCVKYLLEIPKCNDMKKLKRMIFVWYDVNKLYGFINPLFLRKKLKRYYQSRLYNDIRENGIRSFLLFDLRFSQIVKLIYMFVCFIFGKFRKLY